VVFDFTMPSRTVFRACTAAPESGENALTQTQVLPLCGTLVDADHIEGVLRLLQESALGVTFGDVWFNGATQINAALGAGDQLDEREGEYFQALLTESSQTWNDAFDGEMICVPDMGELPTATLAGNATLT
jgi:hypothetical protein